MEDGNGSEKTAKPYYRNVEDTLEDVGITQRQLSYWRKQGLFTPELGPKAKFFTKEDTAQLRFLKRLIDELGLPVATVKRLIFPEHYEHYWVVPAAHFHSFIDIENVRLVQPADAMSALVADAMVGNNRYRVRDLVEAAILVALEWARSTSENADVYEALLKALHDRVDQMDLISRLLHTDEGPFFFWPQRNTDPELTDDLIERLSEEKRQLRSQLDAARARKSWE